MHHRGHTCAGSAWSGIPDNRASLCKNAVKGLSAETPGRNGELDLGLHGLKGRRKLLDERPLDASALAHVLGDGGDLHAGSGKEVCHLVRRLREQGVLGLLKENCLGAIPVARCLACVRQVVVCLPNDPLHGPYQGSSQHHINMGLITSLQ
jgi:hypothetical protein